ncbi:MAG TPA: hypothetical protein VFL64_13495 [Rhizobacter sp.]|nr:hypothetical protein [Rhizobacter sp.]
MNRRAITATFAKAGLAALALSTLGTHSLAQRVSNPIYRPRPGRPGGSVAFGRLRPTDGVARGPLPGAFTVRAVDADRGTIRLADDAGQTADVAVASNVFDLSQLQAGDEVEVDFIVPDGSGDKPLTAAAIWKLERVTP